MYWSAVRDELIRNRDGITALTAQCAAGCNSDISYCALPPEPRWDDRIGWEEAAVDLDYLT